MYDLIKLIGWFIIFFYTLSLMTFVLKRIKINNKIYLKLKVFFIKNHWKFAIVTIIFLLIHGIYMWIFVYPNIFGVMALIFFLITGIFGMLIKKGKRNLIKYHRLISLGLVMLIIAHLLSN